MGLLGIDVYIIRIFEYIRISYANIRIPISAFVDIPTFTNFDQETDCGYTLESPQLEVVLNWFKPTSNFILLIVPRRYFCGGSNSFMFWY